MRAVSVMVLVAMAVVRTPAHVADPFAFFQPTLVVDAEDRERLDAGQPVARTLPARGGSVAVFAAVPIDVAADRLEAWVHQIAAFKQSPQVLAIGRFSDPPLLEDLARLNFPDGDLQELLTCQPGDCGLKLTRREIAELRRCVGGHVSSPMARQDVLRRLVLTRVQTYLAQGQRALGAYEQNSRPRPIAEVFSALLDDSQFLRQQLPQFAAVVERWPDSNGLVSEPLQSFVYWSVENYGAKPIVSATHVFIRRANGDRTGMPETLVIGKQIFATHYIDAWLGVTALVRNTDTGRAYLVYVNRSSLDVLTGFWGRFIRRVIQRRLKAEAPAVLKGIRQRLESGMPLAVAPPSGPATGR
jgi:hypothetical protein